MNLLQSICCLFGNRCIPEEVKQTGGATRPSGPADLGQTEAELERAGKKSRWAKWKVASPATTEMTRNPADVAPERRACNGQ